MNSYKVFFQTLIDELRTKHKFTNAKMGQPQSWYHFSTGVKGLTYAVCFSRNEKVRTEIYIDTGKAEDNKNIFRKLENQKQSIEKEFGAELDWQILENKRASRIAIYREGSIYEDTTALIEIKDWSIEQLLTFKKVFAQRLSETTIEEIRDKIEE